MKILAIMVALLLLTVADIILDGIEAHVDAFRDDCRDVSAGLRELFAGERRGCDNG